MKQLLIQIIAIVFAILAFCAYVLLSTWQLMDFIEGQPNCFPPYVLMSENVSDKSLTCPRLTPVRGFLDLIPFDFSTVASLLKE